MAFHKRSIFLIDPKFQIKFSLLVCSLIFLSSLIYPLLLWDFFNEISTRYGDAASKIMTSRNDFLIFLVTIQIIFTLLVFVLFIFLTHKIAGPLYKLKSHLNKIREGNPISPLTFRDGDHFNDVAEEVTLFLETINQNQENDFNYLDEVSSFVKNLSPVIPDDKKPIVDEIEHRLNEIKSRYKK